MARKFLEPGLEFHRTCQLGRCAPMNSLWTIDYRLPHSGQILGSHINDKLDRLASHQARTVHICQTWQFVICLILINSILHIRSFPTFLTSGKIDLGLYILGLPIEWFLQPHWNRKRGVCDWDFWGLASLLPWKYPIPLTFLSAGFYFELVVWLPDPEVSLASFFGCLHLACNLNCRCVCQLNWRHEKSLPYHWWRSFLSELTSQIWPCRLPNLQLDANCYSVETYWWIVSHSCCALVWTNIQFCHHVGMFSKVCLDVTNRVIKGVSKVNQCMIDSFVPPIKSVEQ